MILPRLEMMASMASDREAVRDPVRVASLREDFRYMAGVCRSILPHLEAELAELPEPVAADSGIEAKISYQMALIRRTNRLHRAVEAHLVQRQAARQARDAQG